MGPCILVARGQVLAGKLKMAEISLSPIMLYKNYEFQIDWKISEGGNSGIIYNVVEDDQYDYVWHTGPEYQLLDNLRHPDGQIEKHRSGDLYDMIKTKFVTVNPTGEWNRTRIKVNNGHVEHWLNGYKVVEFDFWTPEWDALVAGSKFSGNGSLLVQAKRVIFPYRITGTKCGSEI